MATPALPDVVRKPLGAILIILALIVYAALVGLASAWIAGLPGLAQAAVYLVAGLAWVPLLMPLAHWTETGRFTWARGAARRAREETPE